MITKYKKFFENNFNGSEKEWLKILGDIEMCFLEFTDNGWYWSSGNPTNGISTWLYPGFNCILMEDKPYDDKVDRSSIFINGWCIDGEISISNDSLKYGFEKEKEERDDFLTAVYRLNDEIEYDFFFSFNTAGGEKRILIQSK